MEISAEKIEKNFQRHLNIIETFISGERKAKVFDMINSLGDTYIMTPASGKRHYHNAFMGGYIDHVNRVVQYALKQKELYSSMKGFIDFTDEELVMVALFHDLGKVGNGELENYIPQTDKWRNERLGELFGNNPALQFMLIQDRSLYLLQKFGITLTEKEFLGIKLHDGVYEDGNKPYYFSNSPDSKLKTNLVYIIHAADFLASKVEYDLEYNKATK